MKTKIIGIIVSLTLTTAFALPPYIVDYTTYKTNLVTNNAVLTVWGVFTNQSYTAINTQSIQLGESLASAFAKVNSNTTWVVGMLTNLNGTNITPSTINSNKLDTGTLNWLQLLDTRGVLHDAANSTGTAGYVPAADGSGNWNWTAATVVPDTGGSGGTTLMLHASDNGTAMYLHVTSLGVATWTTSP